MRHARFSFVLAVLFAACESTMPDEDVTAELTQSDIEAVAAFIAGQPAIPGSGGLLSAAGAAALSQAPQAGPFDINETNQCPGGGAVAINGKGDRAPNQANRQTTVTMAPTATFTDCVVRTGPDGLILRSGSLSGNGTSLFRWPPAQDGTPPTMISFNLARSGTVNFKKGDKAASCSMSLTTTFQNDVWKTEGKICDKQISSSQKPLGLKS